jgi:hypothetical protein
LLIFGADLPGYSVSGIALTGNWKELHRSRFSELPADCGGQPGESSDPALRDWSQKWTTPDQLRIERYIDQFELRDKRLLHIGIGNSGLATRFHDHTGEIVGTSLDEPELRLARSLGYSNYRVALHNKYSGETDDLAGRFDFIVENNPTSACCCMRHLAELFRLLESKLAEGGQVVTDRAGLAWTPEDANRRWSFDFDDLQAVGSMVGLKVWRISEDTYVLCRHIPPKPALSERFQSLFRRAPRLAARVLRLPR